MTASSEFESCLVRFHGPDPCARRAAADDLAEWEAVDPLVDGLKDRNPGVQEAVMAALIRIGGARVVSSLVPLLREDASTRNLAMEVLEQTGGGALELLLPYARHADANLRKFIIDTLGKLGDPSAIDTLRGALHDPDANVRSAAAGALGRMRALKAVPDLLMLLNDEEWVLFSVIEALGQIGAPAAVPALVTLLHTGSEPLRYAVVEAFGHFHDTAQCLAPMLDLLPQADSALRDLLVKSVVGLVTSSGQNLVALADHDTIIPALLAAAQSDDQEVVRAAISGIGALQDRDGAEAIVRALERAKATSGACPENLLDDAREALFRCPNPVVLCAALHSENVDVVRLAAETLGTLPVPGALPALIDLMAHPDGELRQVVLQALSMIGDSVAVGAVIRALDDEVASVRGRAASILGKWDTPVGLEPLFRRLTVEPCVEVRATIVDALCTHSDPMVGERLISLLTHPKEEVRASAARGLGKLKMPQSFPPLMDSANDTCWSVRAPAIEALGGYRMKAALDAALLALSDDHEQVRLAAVLALRGWVQPQAEEALIVQGLADRDFWVRYRAAEILGHKRAAAAVSALLDMTATEREPVLLRKMAVQALGRIGGERAKERITELMWDREAEVSATASEALDMLEGGEGNAPWK